MKHEKLDTVRRKIDNLFIDHHKQRNWILTKAMLQSCVDVLSDCDCKPNNIQKKAIFDLIEREFGE